MEYRELYFLTLGAPLRTDNSNSSLTRTVFRFPSEFELPGFHCSLYGDLVYGLCFYLFMISCWRASFVHVLCESVCCEARCGRGAK